MKPDEVMVMGSAVLGSKFEAAASKLPPAARAKIRAALDSPRARAINSFRAKAEAAQAAGRAKIARAPAEMAKAKAYAEAKGAERETRENSLRMTLGKCHGLLNRLNAHGRR